MAGCLEKVNASHQEAHTAIRVYCASKLAEADAVMALATARAEERQPVEEPLAEEKALWAASKVVAAAEQHMKATTMTLVYDAQV